MLNMFVETLDYFYVFYQKPNKTELVNGSDKEDFV